jgi:ligand-binding SRPBCC domain-containing protein
MTRLVLVTEIRASAERCFDLSCDIDLHASSQLAAGERAVAGVTSGRIGPGEQVTWRARHFGVWWRMTSEIVEYERPVRFVDQMRSGPFAAWRHEHRFEPHGQATRMVDVADYRVPLGPLGRLLDRLVLARYMRHLLEVRNRYIKQAAEARPS